MTGFHGSLGEIIEGKVLPALVGVTIVLKFGEGEEVRAMTDEAGMYR